MVFIQTIPMKFLPIVALFMFLYASPVKGQGPVFLPTTIENNGYTHDNTIEIHHPHKYECKATREGRKCLILGGIDLAAGCGLLWIANAQSSGNPNSEAGLLPALGAVVFLFGGSVCVLAGTGAYIGGKIHDNHNKRYSLIGSRDKVGIAYNFR